MPCSLLKLTGSRITPTCIRITYWSLYFDHSRSTGSLRKSHSYFITLSLLYLKFTFLQVNKFASWTLLELRTTRSRANWLLPFVCCSIFVSGSEMFITFLEWGVINLYKRYGWETRRHHGCLKEIIHFLSWPLIC